MRGSNPGGVAALVVVSVPGGASVVVVSPVGGIVVVSPVAGGVVAVSPVAGGVVVVPVVAPGALGSLVPVAGGVVVAVVGGVVTPPSFVASRIASSFRSCPKSWTLSWNCDCSPATALSRDWPGTAG